MAGQFIGRAPGVGQQHRAVANQRHVRAGTQLDATAHREGVGCGHRIRQIERHVHEPQVGAGRILFDRPANGQSRLTFAARLEGHQAGNRANRRDVADRLVRMAGAARHQAGERRRVDDLPLLGGVVVDVLVRAGRQEARERVHDRQHAAQRQAAGRRHHVLFGDTAFDEALGQLRLEGLDAAVRQQVRVHHHDLGAMAGHREQFVAVGQHDFLGLDGSDAHRHRRRGQRGRRLAKRVERAVDPRDHLAGGGHVVLQRRRAGVEVVGLVTARQSLHERHALALDGVGNEHLRPVGDGGKVRERVAQHGEVVAVAAPDFPAEGAELVFDRPEVADRRHGGIGLQLVVVDDHRDLGEAFVGDRLQRFPDLAFLQLAVAGHHDNAAAAAGIAVGAGHAVGLGNAHAERAGVGGDERRADVGVPRQAVEAAQLRQQVEAELLHGDQQRVERRRIVALRREIDVGIVAVAVRVAQVFGPQPRDDVGGAEARADVARAGLHDHEQGVDAAQVGHHPGAHDRIADPLAHGPKHLARNVRQRVVTNQRAIRKILFTHSFKSTNRRSEVQEQFLS